jgi:hypothetical protein
VGIALYRCSGLDFQAATMTKEQSRFESTTTSQAFVKIAKMIVPKDTPPGRQPIWNEAFRPGGCSSSTRLAYIDQPNSVGRRMVCLRESIRLKPSRQQN